MDVEKVFHMKGGVGDTSYFNNSSVQKSVAEKMKDITLDAIEQMYVTLRPRNLGIADLGCSSGSNALLYIKRMVGTVEKAAQSVQQAAPEFRVCLNDLPTNDFNTVFQALPDLYQELKKGRNNDAPSVYVAAYPGNFYGRLFPENSLHFVYSFSSLHWLSRVPPGIYDEQGMLLNRKSIYITKNSPTEVCEAYAKQFRQDFSLFLKCRSEEVVTGGRMVLVLTGRSSPDFYCKDNIFAWELLYQSFNILVSKGKVEEEKVDSYDVHYYGPSREEIEDEVRTEGSFKLDRVEMLKKETDCTSSGAAIAKTVRAVQESMLSHHFGEAMLDELFDEYGTLLDREMAKEAVTFIDIALVLTRL
ncbi:Salicylate carboxymethyltransferase [Sesamum alatum]|uniref:Salicylate carboxymethyltransferase n=1 Tax=Sesamum alatum TaxID=300844 RepID=A0AAE1YCL2_9LAMI|nr:Salicylate carboxymethyltransferase [Sesamum alatum]